MNQPRPPRRWIPLGVLGLALSSFGCATGGGSRADLEEQPLGASMDALAEELAEAARQRVDLSSMRVCLREVTELPADDPPPLSATYRPIDLDYLAGEITEELEIALSSRFHLIDSDLFGEPPELAGSNSREQGSQLARHFGASHLVVGTLAPHGDELQLKLRLVDADNWVIVAVARGTVPVEYLSDRSRVALGDLPAYRGSLRPGEPFPIEPVEEAAVAAPAEEIAVPEPGVAAITGEDLEPQPRELEPVEPIGPAAGYTAWKLPKEAPSDRTELDLLLHSRESYGTPTEPRDPEAEKGRAGPAEVRLAALGRKLR